MILQFAALLLSCCLVKADPSEDRQKTGFFLPGNIMPSHYHLHWIFKDDCSQEEEFTFDKKFTGMADITMKAIKPGVKIIEMNALNLRFFHVSLSLGRSSTVLKPIYNEKKQKVLFILPFELPMDKSILLNIWYEGTLVRANNLYGMFIANYTYSAGDTEKTIRRNIIGTAFEPSYARLAYPCFDEPAYKASFTVSIYTSECVLDKGYVAYSNSPVERIDRRKGRAIIHFEKTNVIMSTYLVTFAFAPYVSLPPQQFNSSYPNASQTEWKQLTTWGTNDFIQSEIGALVQKAGLRIMEILTNDLRMGYPLKKLDQINMVEISYNGGMENWGAVFYGFSLSDYLSVVLVAHELAHQWFGNLVTCHWWSDLWLNEGFASYFSHYATRQFALEHPGAEGWNLFMGEIRELLSALKQDTYENHPLTHHVEDPKYYNDFFDVITYNKGGSILRMWNHILGEGAFLKAIQKYLDDRKMDIATPTHLFQAFDSIVNESSSDFGGDLPSKNFETWITQSGYALVTVTKSNSNPTEYILTQRIFQACDDQPPAKWTIPISYSTSSEMDFNKTHAMLWFKEDDEALVISLPDNVNWIIVNNKFTGYYRVNYDMDNWKALSELLLDSESYTTIPIENRIQILSDLFAVAKENSSTVDYDLVMNLTLYLKHEQDYYPWKAAFDEFLSFLDIMLSESEAVYGLFKAYVRDLLQENYSRLSYNRRILNSFSDKELRLETVKWACRMNHSDCITDSRDFLRSYSPRGDIYNEPYEEYDLYGTAYCTRIRYSDIDWDILWRNYSSAVNLNDKKTILHGISCSNNKEIIRRLLMKSVDDVESLSGYERHSILETVIKTDPKHVGVAFDFFIERYATIHKLYSGTQPVTKLLLQFAEKLSTDEELEKMKAFIGTVEGDNDINLTSDDKKRILALIRSNNNWLRERSDQVIFWLLKRYGKSVLFKK